MRALLAAIVSLLAAAAPASEIAVPGYPGIPNPTELGERAAILLYLGEELHLSGLDGESRDGLIAIYKTVIDAQRRAARKPGGQGGLTVEHVATVAEGGKPHPRTLPAGVKLVDKDGKAVDPSGPAKRRFVMLYFSAHWCPPCRAFTPKLVDYYNRRAEALDFDLVFISSDNLPDEMHAYMLDERMPWQAYAWGSAIGQAMSTRFDVTGIPYLVVLDQDDKLVVDSRENGRYVGPEAALRHFEGMRR